MTNKPKLLLLTAFLAVAVLLAACGSGGSIKQQVVTANNSTQLAEQAKEELSFQDYELMQGYVERVHPEVAEGALPVGMTIATMIESQKAYLDAQGIPVEAGEPAKSGESVSAGGIEGSNLSPAAPGQRTPVPPPAAARTDSSEPQAASSTETQLPAQAAAEPAPPPEPKTATLPSGTEIVIRLSQSLSSKTNQPGQPFEAILDEDLTADGRTLAAAGTPVVGKIPQVAASGKVKGKAQMSLTLTQLEVGGSDVAINTNTLNFEAQGTEKKDAKRIGIASGIGAVVGAIAGGGKGAAIGAAIGAGAGTGVTLATSGDEVEFPNEQRMVFQLQQPVELPISR